jgi:hypothetical protein
MSNDESFLDAAQSMPPPVLSLLAKAIERMCHATSADGVVQNHAYMQGIINACSALQVVSEPAARDFCAASTILCADCLDALSVKNEVVRIARTRREMTH